MQPKFRFVVADVLLCLVTVGDVNVGKSVVVEIKCAATPGPAAARDTLAQRGLAKTASALTEVETVSVHELRAHGVVRVVRPGQPQVRQPIHRGRMHADDEEIQKAVPVKVSDRVRHSGGVHIDSTATRVRFAPLTASEIAEYVASGEPMDKAGAYAIQGLASKFVEYVEGCYFNVIGLPLSQVYRYLKSLE